MQTRSAYVLGAVFLATSASTLALSCDDERDGLPGNVTQEPLSFSSLSHRGVTLSGAELGTTLPGMINVDYGYPTHAQIDYYVGKGVTVLKLPFKWERVQHAAFGALDAAEMPRMDDFVNYVTGKGIFVILDMHNYGQYYDEDIGTGSVAVNALGDVWSKLASRYKDNGNVDFGLMHEPANLNEVTWVSAASNAIQAIRSAGANNLILVSGVHEDNAFYWDDTSTGTGNAVSLLTLNDPGNNLVFEAHQFFSDDGSGPTMPPICTSVAGASQRMATFTQWLRSNGRKGFLGAFGADADPVCLDALDDLTNYIQANADIYLGWTVSGAGLLPADFPYLLEPINGQDRPQITRLAKHWPPPPVKGLQGSYYDNRDFTNLKLTRVDPTINFDWGNGSPASSIGADTFSVRWVGQVLPRFTQTYTFFATTDDGVRLWVNGRQIINTWQDRAAAESSGTINLTAGQKADLKLEYYENAGSAVSKLSWSSSSEPKAIIPQSALFAPNTGTGGAGGGAGGAGAGGGGAGGRAGAGGSATGGSTGGMATGGMATGGMATGGMATGGMATGGMATGGMATGGMATGGNRGTGGASGSLSAAIVKFNDWGSGYCANVNVTNNGSGTTSSWTVVFDIASATMANNWNATIAGSGHRYTGKNLSWNGTLASHATAQFGYCANGASAPPSVISVGP